MGKQINARKKQKMRLLPLALSVLALLNLASCQASELVPANQPTSSRLGDDSWAIYWYLCGSNLESGGGDPNRGGAATADLREMFEVELPDNVTIVIETGGSTKWHNTIVDAQLQQRFVYKGKELTLVDSGPKANMADPKTLEDFLGFCNENYPAQNQAVVFWDHGGGSMLGINADEYFPGDMLTLPEIKAALEAKPASSGIYELIGFDACLMATIDVVRILDGNARYMVASQESEPGFGWDYKGFLSAIAQNPKMDGAELGKAICDSYYAFCQKYAGIAETATLSVVDLSKASLLLELYDAAGKEALLAGCRQRVPFFAAFGRAANQSQNYGGGSEGRASPYDMIDLGDLLSNSSDLLPQNAATLIQALEDCVLYQVKGDYKARASGLNCYYHYSSKDSYLQRFKSLGTSEAFYHFYEYTMKGALSTDGEVYVAKIRGLAPIEPNLPEPSTGELPSPSSMDLDGVELIKGENVLWELDLGQNANDYISAMYTMRAYMSEDEKSFIPLGYDINFQADWQRGYFRDGFNGMWYAIDGNLIHVYCNSVQISPDLSSFYQVFESPVLLNGDPYHLIMGMTADRVAIEGGYGHNAENPTYEIFYARPYLEFDEEEMVTLAAKEARPLVPGDVIEPLFTVYPIASGQVDTSRPEEKAFGRFTISDETQLGMELLGDGAYRTTFFIIDYTGKEHYSQSGWYGIVDNMIYSATFE